MFYPAGTKIFVRAASGGDIRKWSMLDETELQQVDNAINEILERCISISCADTKLAFKDLKDRTVSICYSAFVTSHLLGQQRTED